MDCSHWIISEIMFGIDCCIKVELWIFMLSFECPTLLFWFQIQRVVLGSWTNLSESVVDLVVFSKLKILNWPHLCMYIYIYRNICNEWKGFIPCICEWKRRIRGIMNWWLKGSFKNLKMFQIQSSNVDLPAFITLLVSEFPFCRAGESLIIFDFKDRKCDFLLWKLTHKYGSFWNPPY